MFKVTIDIFSGRPNPTWIVDDKKGEEMLKIISKERQVITKKDSGLQGLGYRGINIDILSDDEVPSKIPLSFTIANGVAKDQKKSIEIARMLVDQMLNYRKVQLETHEITPIDKENQKFIFDSLDYYSSNISAIRKLVKRLRTRRPGSGIRVTVNDTECQKCKYEESKFNPAFWNSDSYVRANNNCYNYGRNWRTDTFAQPGRFSGATAGAMSCAEVSSAAIRDGLKKRCDCLPDSEYPRRLMALVIAPGRDYHWYRKQKAGFWGHKPGGTAAKNVDNSGTLITDPRTCDRGSGTYLNYTDFCGFFYAGKSVRIR